MDSMNVRTSDIVEAGDLLRGNDDVVILPGSVAGPRAIPEEYLRKSTVTCEGGDEEGDMITDSCID